MRLNWPFSLPSRTMLIQRTIKKRKIQIKSRAISAQMSSSTSVTLIFKLVIRKRFTKNFTKRQNRSLSIWNRMSISKKRLHKNKKALLIYTSYTKEKWRVRCIYHLIGFRSLRMRKAQASWMNSGSPSFQLLPTIHSKILHSSTRRREPTLLSHQLVTNQRSSRRPRSYIQGSHMPVTLGIKAPKTNSTLCRRLRTKGVP